MLRPQVLSGWRCVRFRAIGVRSIAGRSTTTASLKKALGRSLKTVIHNRPCSHAHNPCSTLQSIKQSLRPITELPQLIKHVAFEAVTASNAPVTEAHQTVTQADGTLRSTSINPSLTGLLYSPHRSLVVLLSQKQRRC